MFMFLFQKKPATKTGFVSNGTELITQLIFLLNVPCSLSQRVNLILSDYLCAYLLIRLDLTKVKNLGFRERS